MDMWSSVTNMTATNNSSCYSQTENYIVFCSVFNTVMKCLGEDLKPAKEGPVTVEFLQDVSGFILSGHKLPE